MSSASATERFETSIAPPALLLSQELMNSIGHTHRPPIGEDLLVDVETAASWLAEVTSEWSRIHGVAVPGLSVTANFLDQLRLLRETLRQLRYSDNVDASSLSADVLVRSGPEGAVAVPKGENLAWITSALAVEALAADQSGELRRLKLCRNRACGVAFFDRSKNNSRAWHNVTTCGNAANVKSFRARAQSQNPPR